MISAEWVSAIATVVSAAAAVIMLLIVRKERADRAGRPLPEATTELPSQANIAPGAYAKQILALVRKYGQAHDKIAFRGFFEFLIGIAVTLAISTIVVIFVSPGPLPFVWVPINVVLFGLVFYLIWMSQENRKERVLAAGHKDVARLMRDPQFTPQVAHELRSVVKRQATPYALADIDDVIFAEFVRRFDTLGSIKETATQS